MDEVHMCAGTLCCQKKNNRTGYNRMNKDYRAEKQKTVLQQWI